MKIILSVFLFFICLVCSSQQTLNTMVYNVFRFPSAPPANREIILKEILNDYNPDLFIVCELESEDGADLILNTSLAEQEDDFDRAVFYSNTSSTTDFIQNMVFFNTRKLILLDQEIHQTAYRDINQYSFKLNTEEADTQPIYLEVFAAHLKSSTGTANQQARLAMVEVFAMALEYITNPNTYVLFAGDFNFYTSSEPGYQKILSEDNAILMIDPIDASGSWHDSNNFKDIHTQSTRVSNSGFGSGAGAGASGGMDDRFDFIMMSENFTTSSDFFYIQDTYKAYGNNGNCLNSDINSQNCSGDFSFDLRDNLYWMSDHTPVVMQFETSQTFLSKPMYEKKPLVWFNSPNIGTDFIELGINTQEITSESKNIYIYNLLGQQVEVISIDDSPFIRWDINSYSSGLYIIRIENSNELLKFIRR